VQDQQQARQSELETVWTRFMEELQHRDAQQQAWDEQYERRISQLETEVQNLRKKLDEAYKTSATIQQAGPCRALSGVAADAAIAATQRLRASSKTPIQTAKPQDKKGATYADVAALLATKPGGKEWQTVPAKPIRTRKVKELTPVAAQEKETRRLIFRREEGLKDRTS
jgi:hypothetical protein